MKIQIKRDIICGLALFIAVSFLPLKTGCPGSKSEKCSWGGVCPPGRVCHDPTETCVLQEQISACRDKDDYEECVFSASTPESRCRQGVCVVPYCGDGILDPDEECDNGEANSDIAPDACRTNCLFSHCGDEVIDTGEECDDGNAEGGDGCSETCEIEHGWYCDGEPSDCNTVCGDGVIGSDEECDDGNSSGGDGCSETCEIEHGWYCDGEPSHCDTMCGDDIAMGDEVCDGEDLRGETCVGLGFEGGVLACLADCSDYDTSLCLADPPVTWISITGGTFPMGSINGDADEMPVRSVTVPTFEMAKTQVTVAQYAECVAAGACSQPTSGQAECNWTDPVYENHPINCVNWFNALDFCTWAGGRLPSEAEWEYAARSGGKNNTYPWGEDSPTCEYAVMNQGGFGCGTGQTWAVCSKEEKGNTDQGLCDMAGNVWEWLQDWYHDSYEGAPSDGSAREHPVTGSRVKRGGSVFSSVNDLRATNRYFFPPNDIEDYTDGIRCAR